MYIANPHPRLAALAPNGQPKVDFLAWYNDGFVIDAEHLLAGRPELVKVDLLPEATTQPKITPRGLVLHTQGGSRQATNEQARSFFLRLSSNESHLVGPQMVDGKVIQLMPFNVRADSNYLGNEWWYQGKLYGHLSIETQDSGFLAVPLDRDPWTLPQLNVLAGIATALCATYGISCGDMPTPTSSGIVAHNRWPAFTKSGHNCPGPARTRQVDWVRAEVAKRLAAYYAAVGETCPGAA